MTVTEEDAKVIIRKISKAYDKMPSLVKPLIPSLPSILSSMPECAKKYTLQELIELLEKAHRDGRIP